MTYFETLAYDKSDTELLKAIRQHRGKAWTINADIEKLRARLLELQNYRCAYCQGFIELDEVGHRELDHILPKSPSDKCTTEKGTSNIFKDRQHTFGYPQFTFEPRNLIITCKVCNSFKKSFDPITNRTTKKPYKRFPHHDQLLWFYPYKHTYSSHIKRTKNWLYKNITPQGEAVIKTCKLDKSNVLTARFGGRALIRAKQANGLRAALGEMASAVHSGKYAYAHARIALISALDVPEEHADNLLTLWIEYYAGGGAAKIEKVEKILIAILGLSNANTDDAAKALSTSLEIQTLPSPQLPNAPVFSLRWAPTFKSKSINEPLLIDGPRDPEPKENE